MFDKLRLKLTLLCSLITIAILWTMTALFWISSVDSQRQNICASFQNDMNALLANLESQDTISHAWLKKMQNRSYSIYLTDSGSPYVFNRLSLSPQTLALSEQILSWYQETVLSVQSPSLYQPVHEETGWYQAPQGFSGQPAGQKKEGPASLFYATHLAGCMTFLKNGVPVTAVAVFDLSAFHRKLFWQGIGFLCAAAAGAVLLSAFSFFFVGRILAPAYAAQKRQIEFIASASHELRTPLSAILACSGACRVAPKEEQDRFLDSIDREGKRMQGLLSDLLLLADGTPKRASLCLAETDMETLLLNLYENFESLAMQRRRALLLSLPDTPLPKALCDPEKITQLLSVLIQNALSYTPEGGQITLSAHTSGRKLLLSVTDTGCGIPDSQKALVFERFYRTDSSRSQKGHFGLGLCIAADIAKAHRAKITVADNSPCGTVFTLHLPL